MFERAQKVTVTGGVFTNVGANHSKDPKSEGLRQLQHKIAPGAFHNSAERYNPPKCHPHTRQAVLKKIMDWVTDMNKLCLFMWIYGPAGAGKSAIAQTMADICSTTGILAASFFFCRTAPGRNGETLFITTVVYQLMLSIPEIAPRVGKALAEDPLVLSRSLEAQIKALIINPLNETAMDEHDGPNLVQRPKLIIVDGLDECSESKSQRYILETLFSAAEELSVPLFFLVSSRPEPRIRDTFNDPRWSVSSNRIALDDRYQPEADIRVFLEARFQDIRRKYPSLSPSWPSRSEIHALVQKSSGQFIYVSTVMKYLDSDDQWPPDRLKYILGLSTPDSDGMPFAEIDAIYHHILNSVSDIDRVMDILTFLLMVEFWSKTQPLIEDFLGYRRGEADIILNDLHSLIGVPPSNDEDLELRIWHSSLSDFLFDKSRSGKFFINPREAHGKLTGFCIRHLKMVNSPFVEDPTNMHHLRSLLMVNCVESDPSAQVLKDLYDLDMRTYLNFWVSDDNVVGVYEHDTKRIVNLLMWLKTQRHPGFSTDLFQHHREAIDDWIVQQLNNYPRKSNLHEFLAVGILTNFMSEEIFEILRTDPISKSTFTKVRRFDPLQIYAHDREYSNFYNILSDFLLCRERSGKYFAHGKKFATLSLIVLSFLASNKSTEIERYGLDLLPSVLSKSSKSAELAEALFIHPLFWMPNEEDALYSRKLAAYQAIKHYLERRDLPTVASKANIHRTLPGPGSTISMPVMPTNGMSPDERLRMYAGQTSAGAMQPGSRYPFPS